MDRKRMETRSGRGTDEIVLGTIRGRPLVVSHAAFYMSNRVRIHEADV